jgi:hypothetical protein
MVQSLPWQISQKKKKNHKKRAGGVAQGIGPEFKPQYQKKKKEKKNLGGLVCSCRVSHCLNFAVILHVLVPCVLAIN